MSKHLTILSVFLAILLASSNIYAVETVETVEKVEEVDIHAIPPILDPHFRHNKKYQFELAPYAGAYLGNTVGQTWMAGARLYFFFNNTVAVGANYGYSKLLTNTGSPFGSILTNANMQSVMGEVVFSNDAALRIGNSLLEMDFFGTFALGSMLINNSWQLAGMVGGGIKFYTGVPWLALRIDVNNYVHNTAQPGNDIVDFDVTFLGGVSILFPSKPSAYER